MYVPVRKKTQMWCVGNYYFLNNYVGLAGNCVINVVPRCLVKCSIYAVKKNTTVIKEFLLYMFALGEK